MRTTLVIVTVIVAAVVVGGVTSSGTATMPNTTTSSMTTSSTTTPTVPTSPLPDLYMATDRAEVVLVEDGVAYPPWHGIIGLGGRTWVSTKGNVVVWHRLGGGTEGVPIDGPVGDRIAATELVPLVTDLAEEWAAFGPPHEPAAEGTIAAGRESTEIVAVSRDGTSVGVVLPGNFVPEAFSLEPEDGAAPWLYVLEYLPAEAPTHYRVRLLDPNTGELSYPVNLRLKTATVDTQMAGVSRDQVVATDRGFLFTLYRGNHGEDVDYAFIHTLSMWGGVWCLVVPDELELATTAGAIAISPDESVLYAVSANGSVAEYSIDDVVDPQRSPDARRTAPSRDDGTARPTVTVTREHLVIARGGVLEWLRRDDLSVETSVPTRGIEALAALPGTDSVLAKTDILLTVVGPGEPVDGGLKVAVHGVTQIVPG